VQGIEKGIEDTKLGQGMGMPMNVVEPTKEKELPNAPNAATRSRSGTGKSQKGKSIFGLSFSGTSFIPVSHTRWYPDLLGKEKTPVISTPYDPIHLTHVGFDYNTGQCRSFIQRKRNTDQHRYRHASGMAKAARW
jgi:p21-activated kinase 1